MKNILFLLLIVFSSKMFSQTKIDGAYSCQDTWNWYSLKFYSDSLFTHSSWACGGGGESHGTYKVNGNVLSLKYISNDTLKNYSKEKINCDSLHKNNFNKYQFSFKNGDVKTYKIKTCNTKKIILSDDKYDYPFYRNRN